MANRDIGEGLVSGLPDSFWGEAAQAFVHVTNRFPTAPVGDKTPHELWYGTKPDVSHLRVWGCRAYVHIQRDQRTNTPESAPLLATQRITRRDLG
jgi:hypothetical protein